ncbi:MAG: 1-deoxy-D-xylulose-5-phosphate synthase [Acutalibacteraceae bacterium]|jgi:1-deoxy-D-xylulose-5-phosphate synthase
MKEPVLLKNIKSPKDLKRLDEKELPVLAEEIRSVLVETVSKTGGHLASNLGVVELTLALHRVFNSPIDHIIWDVSHQSYTHKLLTGRLEQFDTLRTRGGLSGYTKPEESVHDFFQYGHSATAASAALGIAEAKRIKKDNSFTVAVVGDGSLTGGLIYESLNNAGRTKSRLIVVINDNEMSISQNVGAMARYLTAIRTKPRYYRFKAKTERVLNKIPLIGPFLAKAISTVKSFLKNIIYESTWFEELGFHYIGPIDGHDLHQLTEAFKSAKVLKHPVVVHVNTIKGKGYDFAEKEPTQFHGVSKFDINTGEPIPCCKSYSTLLGEFLCEVAEKDRRICAITAAMSVGTGLELFRERFPQRFFDVGIAESHAVTFASGLAAYNMLPVFAVYSTFLQRSYDQLIHDAALQGRKIVLAIDRAGFVGEDGETHQGVFDVAYLNTIPDITVYSPANFAEFKSFMNKALYHEKGVVAVRYPRGEESVFPEDFTPSLGSFDVYSSEGAQIALITYGRIFAYACQAKKALEEKGIPVKIIKINRVKPIDGNILDALTGVQKAFFFEEGIRTGGIGEKLGSMLLEKCLNLKYKLVAVADCFVEQGSVAEQLAENNLDKNGMLRIILEDENDGGE